MRTQEQNNDPYLLASSSSAKVKPPDAEERQRYKSKSIARPNQFPSTTSLLPNRSVPAQNDSGNSSCSNMIVHLLRICRQEFAGQRDMETFHDVSIT